MSAKPTTDASKVTQIKAPVPGRPVFGCGTYTAYFISLLRKQNWESQGSCDEAFTDKLAVHVAEHVQLLMTQNRDLQQTSISHYKAILRCIFENPPVIPETSIAASGQNVTSLTSNYLCLQCPQILGVEERLEHGNKKSHRFCKSCDHEISLLTTCPLVITLPLTLNRRR